MCLHKHTTIVHQHLYNIKGVIYKSTGLVHRAVQAWRPTQQLSAVSPQAEEPVQASVTRPRCPSLGPSSGRQQVYEHPSGPVLVGIWGQEPQEHLCLGLTGKLV